MKKNKIIYIAVIISFIIYLFFSNSIISSFAGNIFSSLKIPHETLMKDKVYSGLKRPNYSSHLFEKVYFEGWALCETENDNSEKEIGILLKNEKEEYIFVNEASTIRKDIKADFSSKAQGNRHGFIYSISTIPISDGMYDIFIYCKENEYNFGLARTRYSLIKHGVNVEIKTTESNIVENLDLSNIIETGIINIDKTETETDGSVSISGWALVPEKGTEEQKVFIRIEDEEGRSAIYDTNSFTRSDVATFFSNDLYLSAGFSANFPIEDATDCKVSVLIQNGDKIYTSSDMNTMLFMSKEIEIREFSNVLEDSIIHIDNKQLKGSAYLDISGWAFVPDQDSSKQKVYIQLTYKDGTSDIFDTRSISRPDVAEFYSNELCTWSGFQAKIPVEMIREKENEISILIEDEDGVHTTPEMFSTVQAYKPSTLERQNVKVESETVYTTEPAGGIMGALAVPLNALMRLCYQWTKNYALAIILFTLFTKIILFPISMWTQRNSIKMVEIMPAINRLKVKYFGDKETIAEETQKLYKQVNYHPLASTVPMLIQIVLLMGVIDAVKAMIGSDANSVYAQIPIQKGGISLLMPVAAAIAAICLGLTQNRIGPLQKEQERKEQIVTNAISVGISLFLGAFVSIGTCVYWIASNLISIPLQVILNKTVNPKKYIDYQALNESKEKLREYDSLSVGISKEDKKREKEDYKKFFSVVNKHLVFYSEGSGYYKYYKGMIEYILQNTNLTIHYITSDPQDQIFELAKTNPAIRPYYIGEKRLITLMMKLDADIVAMTMPDIETYHIKRSYVRKDIEYVYIPHGVGSTNLLMTKTSTDHYDTIFCTNEILKQEELGRERVYGVPHRKLLEIGYPLLDEMRRDYRNQKHVVHERKKILIAPSWQEDNIIDSCLEEMLDCLKGRGYDITVRPHPQEVRHKKQYIETLKEKYAKDGIEVQTDFSSNSTVFEADLLITDWSDISTEFSFTTDKPVLFINTPMKIMNPDYEQIDVTPLNILLRTQIGKSLELNELDQVPATVDELLSRTDYYQEEIEKLVQEHVYNLGKSARIAGTYLIRQIQKKISEKGEQNNG